MSRGLCSLPSEERGPHSEQDQEGLSLLWNLSGMHKEEVEMKCSFRGVRYEEEVMDLYDSVQEQEGGEILSVCTTKDSWFTVFTVFLRVPDLEQLDICTGQLAFDREKRRQR